MSVTINDTTIEATEFAWDGCHKIYVVTDKGSRDVLAGYGFYDFYPVSELQEVWDASCPLKFISSANLKETYVSQSYEGPVRIVT